MRGITKQQCEAVMSAFRDGGHPAPWTAGLKGAPYGITLGDFILRHHDAEGWFDLLLPDGQTVYPVVSIDWSYGIRIRMTGWELYLGREQA